MKKYLLALLLMPLIFCQCNPDDNNTEQEGIYLSGRAYATGAKTDMTNQNGTGIIKWSQSDKFFSYAINTQNIFIEFRNDGNGGNVFTSVGTVVSSPSQYIRFYRIGESELEVTKWVTTNHGNKIPIETGINISIAEQTGNIVDFSKYHISKSNDVIITSKYIGQGQHENKFGDATFTSMIAYANFDLSEYSDKDVVISVEGANNHFCLKSAEYGSPNYDPSEIFSQVEDTNGTITVTNPSENTYVAFLPSESSTLNFSVDGENIGSVTFPTNGVIANCFYTGANGNPIKIGGRVIVVK